jgi:hypothetical protein
VAASFGAAFDQAAPVASLHLLTFNARKNAANAAEILRSQRLAMLAGYVEGVVRTSYVSRPDGLYARASLVERFEVELSACIGAADKDLYVALQNLRAKAVAFLTKLIADLRPIVTVSAPRALPSLWWAWRLYQDPTRAAEIIARNKVPHPSFCPERLDVLAPGIVTAAQAPI